MTKWYRPAEKLPEQNEEVLVKADNLIELATYDKTNHSFFLRNGTSKSERDSVKWLRIQPDDES